MGLPTSDLVNALTGFAPARFEEILPGFACEIGNDAELLEDAGSVGTKSGSFF